MSFVTGSNEEEVMWVRGVFGLLQWEVLPPDARARAITDLSGVMIDGELQGAQAIAAKRVLAIKTPSSRGQIALMLTEAGVMAQFLSALGLAPPTNRP